MPKKKRKYTKAIKTTKPLTVAIHGEGIDIDAKFDGVKKNALADVITMFAKQVSPPPFVEDQVQVPGDHFAFVELVIANCNLDTLREIDLLVVKRFDQLAPASTQPAAQANANAAA